MALSGFGFRTFDAGLMAPAILGTEEWILVGADLSLIWVEERRKWRRELGSQF